MKWWDWAILAAGAVAAPYTGGASMAAASSVVGAHNASQATNEARDAEVNASEKALALQRETNAQNQRNLSPFLGLGSQAAEALGPLVLGSHYRPQGSSAEAPAVAPAETPAPSLGQTRADQDAINKRGTPMTAEMDTANKGGSLMDYANPAELAKTQRSSSYVTMQAPNGEIEDVPMEHVEHFKARGGKVLQMGAA